jgi:transposase InsO family protein
MAKAFLGVMTHFGACAEVLTVNGTEFRGEFEQLCQKLFMDHRYTSRYHPQSNGLTERLMRTSRLGSQSTGRRMTGALGTSGCPTW